MECLNQWRRASAKETRYQSPPLHFSKDSFFRCDECRHEYSFRINSAYFLTTRRSFLQNIIMTYSNSNSFNTSNIHRNSIHPRNINKTGLIPNKNPNSNPSPNDFSPSSTSRRSNRDIGPQISRRCTRLPRPSALGFWTDDTGNNWIYTDVVTRRVSV